MNRMAIHFNYEFYLIRLSDNGAESRTIRRFHDKSIFISLFHYRRFMLFQLVQSISFLPDTLGSLTGVTDFRSVLQPQRQIFTLNENCKYKLLMHVLCTGGFRYACRNFFIKM